MDKLDEIKEKLEKYYYDNSISREHYESLKNFLVPLLEEFAKAKQVEVLKELIKPENEGKFIGNIIKDKIKELEG